MGGWGRGPTPPSCLSFPSVKEVQEASVPKAAPLLLAHPKARGQQCWEGWGRSVRRQPGHLALSPGLLSGHCCPLGLVLPLWPLGATSERRGWCEVTQGSRQSTSRPQTGPGPAEGALRPKAWRIWGPCRGTEQGKGPSVSLDSARGGSEAGLLWGPCRPGSGVAFPSTPLRISEALPSGDSCLPRDPAPRLIRE